MLAEQPEFASNARMRELLRLTEGRDLLKQALAARRQTGLSITIGAENPDARLTDFTLVTASYRGRRAQGRDRRHGTDPHAVRQDHRAGGAHQPPGGGAAGVSEFYVLLGVAARRVRRRHQEGLSEAGHGVPSRPQSRARGGGQVQGDHRGVRGPARSPEARGVRPLRQGRASAAPAAGSGSTTWICPKRSTSSCATSAAWAGSSRCSAAGGPQADARRGQDVRVTVKLSLAEVATGVKKTVSFKAPDRCANCEGTGAKPGTKPIAMRHLRRQRRGAPRGAQHVRAVRVACRPVPPARGEGVVVSSRARCAAARGGCGPSGRSTVEIPAGVSANNYLTLRGQGAAGPRNGPAGDLLVMLDIKDDDRFERQGDDLIFDLPLSFSQVALGVTGQGAHAVRRGGGSASPPGTQPETIVRLRGRGLPVLGQSSKGDLIVRVHVWTPERLSAEQERLFQRARQARGRAAQALARVLVQAQGSARRMTWWAIDVRPDPSRRERVGRVAGGADRPGGRGAGRRDAGHLRRGRARRPTRWSRRSRPRAAAPVETSRRPLEPVDWTTRWRDGLGAAALRPAHRGAVLGRAGADGDGPVRGARSRDRVRQRRARLDPRGAHAARAAPPPGRPGARPRQRERHPRDRRGEARRRRGRSASRTTPRRIPVARRNAERNGVGAAVRVPRRRRGRPRAAARSRRPASLQHPPHGQHGAAPRDRVRPPARRHWPIFSGMESPEARALPARARRARAWSCATRRETRGWWAVAAERR